MAQGVKTWNFKFTNSSDGVINDYEDLRCSVLMEPDFPSVLNSTEGNVTTERFYLL